MYAYMHSPWMMPTICLTWFFVLTLTHIHNFPWLGEERGKSVNSSFGQTAKFWPRGWKKGNNQGSLSDDAQIKSPYNVVVQPTGFSFASHSGIDGSGHTMDPTEAQVYGVAPAAGAYQNSSV